MQISIFDIVCVLLLIPPVLSTVYYWGLALYELVSPKSEVKKNNKAVNSFAIIIPAHNEENVISETLESCLNLDYPKEKFDIYVIADNCSDDTAKVVKGYGITCYERHNDIDIGKGFALTWAFEKLMPKGHDCFFIIDADCDAQVHALKAFDGYIQKGYRVLQANDVSSNPDASSMSYATAVGSVIENDLFYAPKSKLGLSVFLRGTGMVFHKSVLSKFPWSAHSIVEDVEYTLKLLANGLKILFVQEVKVGSPFPTTKKQLDVQRTRWASGNINFAKKNALKLLFDGLIRKNMMLIDSGCTLLVLSRPLILVISAFVWGFSSINWMVSKSALSLFCFGLSTVQIVLLGLYLVLGIFFLGITPKRVRLLLSSPFIVLRLIVISISNTFGSQGLSWEKTPRKGKRDEE